MDYPRKQIQLRSNSIDILQPELISRNTVKIRFDINVDQYLRDSTGFQTLTGTDQSLHPRLLQFNIISTDLRKIYETLRNYRFSHQDSEFFASHIVHVIDFNKGLGVKGFEINFLVTLTYERVYTCDFDFQSFLLGENDVVERLVREGVINEETWKSLNLETESCSICFENILGTKDKAPTRMSCSHVFHDRCISQWLRRKNSCPLCRETLYCR